MNNVGRLRAWVNEAVMAEADADALQPGRGALFERIAHDGFDPACIVALARIATLGTEQRVVLATYARALEETSR